MRLSLRRLATPTCCVVALASILLAAGACSKPDQGQAQPPASGAALPPSGAGGPAATQPAAPAPGAADASSGGQPAGGAGGPAAATGGGPAVKPAPAPAPPPPPPPPPPPRRFTLEAGTVIAVQTDHTLSSDTQAAGEKFAASLAEPIVDGDWVIAKEGAVVEGLVVSSTKGGRVKGTAQLELAITAIALTDGRRVPVTAALAAKAASSSKKKDAGRIGIAAGVGTAIGAIAGGGKGAAIGAAAGGVGGTALVLGTRGKPAEIPARTVLQFQVTKPVEIVEKR